MALRYDSGLFGFIRLFCPHGFPKRGCFKAKFYCGTCIGMHCRAGFGRAAFEVKGDSDDIQKNGGSGY